MIVRILFAFSFIALLSGVVSAVPTASFFFDLSGNETIAIHDDIIRSSSVIFQVLTNEEATCRYSVDDGVPYSSMSGTFDFSFDTLHREDLLDLSDGVYRYYIRCKDSNDVISREFETVFSIIAPVTAEIRLSEDSPLGSGLIDVTLTTSKTVEETPSLSYSLDGSDYDPVPLSGSGTRWEGHIIISRSAGEAVGSFRFSAKDLEGFVGTEITDGAVFLIDTLKPATIIEIDASGFSGGIHLDWRIEEEDTDYYNVYRSTSPNVGYSDFYKEVDGEKFSDTFVSIGDTHYYRVAAVDEAGNEGDLSIEVFATALAQNITADNNGLAPELHGLVDSELASIRLALEDIERVRNSFDSSSDEEQEIYFDLALDQEVSSALTELRSLESDVSRYKSQSLTAVELDNKLASVNVKLNSIRTRVPESFIIIDEQRNQQELSEEIIRTAILTLTQDFEGALDRTRLQRSLDRIEESGFRVESVAYHLEVVYLDGSRDKQSLIQERIDFGIGRNSTFSIVEILPPSLGSVSDVRVTNENYEVLQRDSVLGFPSETIRIAYILSDHIDFDSVSELQTVLLHEAIDEQPRSSLLTGYATLIDLEQSSYYGVGFGIFVVAILLVYFFVTRQQAHQITTLKPIYDALDHAEALLRDDEIDHARDIYDALCVEYGKLKEGTRKRVYARIEKLGNELRGALLE